MALGRLLGTGPGLSEIAMDTALIDDQRLHVELPLCAKNPDAAGPVAHRESGCRTGLRGSGRAVRNVRCIHCATGSRTRPGRIGRGDRIETPPLAALEHEGYEASVVRNGREALDLLRQGFRPCVILLDLALPEMDGYQFRRLQ